jgi:hypothetical protein
MPVISNDQEAVELMRDVERAFSETERKNFETGWDELTRYTLPMQGGLFNVDVQTPGDRKTQDIYDITGVQANSDLAATFHSTLTNPATRWSNIEHSDPELQDDDEARTWLEDSRNRMHKAFSQSNFDVEAASNYQMFTSLGTMSLMQDALPLKLDGTFGGFFFKAWHLARVAFEENQYGIVDRIYRKFQFTKQQAMERWGKHTPKLIVESNQPDKKFDIYHIIRPRAGAKPVTSLLVPIKDMPFESLYVFKASGEVVERGGYMEFPNHVTRWSKMPGEKYGRGPGHLAIPDIRTLNRMVELGLTAIARGIAPPIFAERRNIFGSLNLKPNGVTQVADISKIREFVTQARSDLYQFTKDDYRNSIRQAFFLDKLLLPPREEVGEMTAFEVARRIEQTQRVLGPTFGRLNQEFLQPLVLRSFKMMLRGGAFAEPPQSVLERGLNIEVKFVNALARSQQIEEVSAINQWTQILGQLAQLEQFQTAATDLIDVDAAGETSARILGVPEDVIADKDVRASARGERKALEQQQIEAQVNLQNADAESKRG